MGSQSAELRASWGKRNALLIRRAAVIAVSMLLWSGISYGLQPVDRGARSDESPAGAASAPSSVEYNAKTDQLKVSVAGASFKQVMETLAAKTGRKVVVTEGVESRLTVDFDFMPFEAGLMQLLKGKNYALHHSDDGSRITTVLVLSGLDGRVADPSVKAAKHLLERKEPSVVARNLPRVAAEIPPAQVDALLDLLREQEAVSGENFRKELEELRESVDPGFDPKMDAEGLTDEELLGSVLNSALRALSLQESSRPSR